MNLTSMISGIVFVVIGALFLLDRLEIMETSGALIFPIMLVGVGAGILLGSLRRERKPAETPAPPD